MSAALIDPDPEAEWQVWYEDTFDRECPRQVEIAGRGLANGLIELWTRHLFETVQADGQEGFSRFNLWWKQKEQSITIIGKWEGSIRVRKWIFGDNRQTYAEYTHEGDKELLMTLAVTHGNLVLDGRTSEAILAEAKAASSRKDFETRLLNLHSA
ncbi:MAG: hypothetical protein AB8I69_02970 [Anaerolineae bacterium]